MSHWKKFSVVIGASTRMQLGGIADDRQRHQPRYELLGVLMAEDSTLLKFLFGPPKEAGKDISLRKKYNERVRKMQEQGQTPPSFEEFKQQQSGGGD